jgi:hypothetical protein
MTLVDRLPGPHATAMHQILLHGSHETAEHSFDQINQLRLLEAPIKMIQTKNPNDETMVKKPYIRMLSKLTSIT